MTTLERSIVIYAPVESIEAVLNDARGWPRMVPGVQEAVPDARYPEEGSRVRVVYKSAGITFKVVFTVLEHVPAQKQIQQMEGMIAGVETITFSPEGDGIRVNQKFEYEIPGDKIGKVLDRLVFERMNAEQVESGLRNLKQRIEG